MFFFALDDALDGFEVAAGELVREAKEGLVLAGLAGLLVEDGWV